MVDVDNAIGRSDEATAWQTLPIMRAETSKCSCTCLLRSSPKRTVFLKFIDSSSTARRKFTHLALFINHKTEYILVSTTFQTHDGYITRKNLNLPTTGTKSPNACSMPPVSTLVTKSPQRQNDDNWRIDGRTGKAKLSKNSRFLT